jgi:endonuclease-8
MPEAPQVRILVNKLQPFVGMKIVETTLVEDFDTSRLLGETIQDIRVFGKQILILLPKFTVRYHLLVFGVIRINDRNENGKSRLGLKLKMVSLIAMQAIFITSMSHLTTFLIGRRT